MSTPDPAQRRAAASDSAVDSPCIRRCCLDDEDTCLGCFRTLDEIVTWASSNNSAKRHILAQAAQRKAQRSDT